MRVFPDASPIEQFSFVIADRELITCEGVHKARHAGHKTGDHKHFNVTLTFHRIGIRRHTEELLVSTYDVIQGNDPG